MQKGTADDSNPNPRSNNLSQTTQGGPSLMNWWTSTNAFIAKTSNGPNIQPKMNSALRFPRGPLIGNHDKNAMRNQIPSGPNFRYQSMGPSSSSRSTQFSSCPSLSSSSGTSTGLVVPSAICSQSSTDALHSKSRSQNHRYLRQSNCISVPPPHNSLDTIFNYHKKIYPSGFHHYLKLTCTYTRCYLCMVSFLAHDVKIPMAHYEGNIHEQSLKNHFDYWMKNYKVQRKIVENWMKKIQSPRQAQSRQIQNRYQSRMRNHHESFDKVQANKIFEDWKKDMQAQRQAYKQAILAKNSGSNNRYNLICTKCAQRGHERENCPQNLICGKCGKDGHLRKDCKVVPASGEDSDEDEIQLIAPPAKPAPEVVDLEETETDPIFATSAITREEFELDEMPIFEMDSAYIQDRIKQEIIIENPESDSEDEPLSKRRRVKQKKLRSRDNRVTNNVKTETDELKENCLKNKPVVKITKITDEFVKMHIKSANQLTETDEQKEKCLKIKPVVNITKITDDFVKIYIKNIEKPAGIRKTF